MSRVEHILSTKKLKPNQKQLLIEAGFSVIDENFIRTTALPFLLDDIQENLIFTSQNAVKSVAEHPEVQQIRRNPVFCVGEKTANLLDEVGFTVIESAQNAAELAQIIVKKYSAESFTFFSGNIRRNELPEALQLAHIELNEIEVYETELTPTKIEAEVDGILFFSPSAAESFCSENALSAQAYFCIGETTADHLIRFFGLESSEINHIMVANIHTVESTITECIDWFNYNRH